MLTYGSETWQDGCQPVEMWMLQELSYGKEDLVRMCCVYDYMKLSGLQPRQCSWIFGGTSYVANNLSLGWKNRKFSK